MSDLKLYEGQGPLIVTPATIFSIVKEIIAAGREAEFLKAAEPFQHSIQAQSDIVNLVKTFLYENKLHEVSLEMKTLVKSPRGSTSCFPPRG